VTDIKTLSGGTLAFLGDAVWSLYVREYFIDIGHNRPNDLQHKTVKMVSAKAQKSFYDNLLEEDYFNEIEIDYFKRGRNFSSKTTPRNTDVATYKYSTGFEALIGYLYLEKQNDRIEDIFNRAKEMVNL
jgi:ribonuclease-3 family protein